MSADAHQLALLAGAGAEAGPKLSQADALRSLAELVGRDLRPLADLYGVTVHLGGHTNKGWAGQTVERYLGRAPDSSQAADFGDWELKVVPLYLDASGRLRLKETMAITMFTAGHLEETDFEASHLLEKLGRIVVVARTWESPDEPRSIVHSSRAFELDDPALRTQVREDYEEARWAVRDGGVGSLTARIGRWVQPRPKGAGRSRGGLGFYARKALVARMLGLD